MAKLNQILMGLALLLCAAPLAAQSCYVQLDDATGVPLPPAQLSELEAAACELRDAFPAEFQNDFAVYDFGFYLHQEGFAGGVPEVFQAKVTEVEQESAYFLLFGRQLSRGGGTSEVWVEVRLPESGLCLTDLQLSIIADQIRWVVLDSYLDISIGIKWLSTEVEKLVECCQQSGFQGSICDICPSASIVKRFLEEQGFWSMDIDSFGIVDVGLSRGNAASLLDASGQITVWEDGEAWDLNDDLLEMLTSFVPANVLGVLSTVEDMCHSSLYKDIQTSQFLEYDYVIVMVLWYRKNADTGEITDKLLFIKEFDNVVWPSDIEEYDQDQEAEIICHPGQGVFSSVCAAEELSYDFSSFNFENGFYTIAESVNENGRLSYYGYKYIDSIFNWGRVGVSEYYRGIPSPHPDNDDHFNDCDSYLKNSYSAYARKASRESTKDLITVFERYTMNNLLAKKELLNPIIKHFYTGGGEKLAWDCGTDFSRHVYRRAVVQDFLTAFQGRINEWLAERNDLDGFFTDASTVSFLNLHTFEGGLLGHVPGNAGTLNNATTAIAIGGVQGWRIGIPRFVRVPATNCESNRCYSITVHLVLLDTFGAGTSDRDRGGSGSSFLKGANVVPGLTEMWLLQHCRNADCHEVGGGGVPCFVPFIHEIHMGHEFKVCYD